jgi:polyisoprenoid-binding protein YceI
MTILTGPERVTLVPAGTWEVGPGRSTVGFAVRHLKVTKVRGRFREVTGVVRCDSEGVASIDGAVGASTPVIAGATPGFAPRTSSTSSSIRRSPSPLFPCPWGRVIPHCARDDDGARPLELQLDALASPVDGNGDLRIRANGVVSRREFGLEWDPAFAAGGLVIDDRVGLRLDIVVVRPTAVARH